jgi:hypothetical protein
MQNTGQIKIFRLPFLLYRMLQVSFSGSLNNEIYFVLDGISNIPHGIYCIPYGITTILAGIYHILYGI